ncbi:MAG: polyprenol monophosphomannose synthase [Thermoplasmata archaeon]
MVDRVSVILPTYNERESLARLDPELQTALRTLPAEIVVVDDASPDGTADLVRQLPGPVPHRLVERSGKLGLSSAVIAGIGVAQGEILVVMDADGSHPPEAIPPLVGAVDQGAEFALGSRHVPGGTSEGLGPGRRILSRGATLLARPIAPVRDPMSGFFAFRRSILRRATLSPRGFKIGLEILVRCRPRPVREIPIAFRPRFAGESKLTRGEIRNYVRHLAGLYAVRAGLARPPR